MVWILTSWLLHCTRSVGASITASFYIPDRHVPLILLFSFHPLALFLLLLICYCPEDLQSLDAMKSSSAGWSPQFSFYMFFHVHIKHTGEISPAVQYLHAVATYYTRDDRQTHAQYCRKKSNVLYWCSVLWSGLYCILSTLKMLLEKFISETAPPCGLSSIINS